MASLLESLRIHTTVVADTGDFESMKRYQPTDATTNPSLILKAVQQDAYRPLLDRCVKDNPQASPDILVDKLLVSFGREILNIVPGRVSTEVDARLSFDSRATIERARRLIALYRDAGFDRDRILIKIASTWEGIQAAQALEADGGIDAVVYCAGHYKPLRATAFDLAEMLRHDQVNYVGALHVLDAVLPGLLARGAGHVSLISSVAGFRGLPRSLAYGPTKAALINLAETLYIDLQDRGIGVSVINPGFVETPLTAQNEFPMPALMTPREAAAEILRGWARGAFEIHFPRRFTLWLKLCRILPFRLHQALVRRLTGL